MSRHFLCCIPVRFGVFLFSLASLLLSGLLSIMCWYGVHLIVTKSDGFTNVPKRSEIILIVVGVVWTTMTLTSFLGLIGSITRNRRFVKSFSFMSILQFLASLASTGLFLWTVWTEKNVTADCISNNNGTISIDNCDTHLTTGVKIAVTAIAAVLILVHLYIVVVVRRYVEQLEDEADLWQGPYKLTSTEVNHGLMQSGAAYPYSDPTHSYGNP